MIERSADNLEELLSGRRLSTVTRHELRPRLWLRGLDERDDLLTEDPHLSVVCGGFQLVPAVAEQVCLDVRLDRRLLGDAHGGNVTDRWTPVLRSFCVLHCRH